jgi:serine/threonine protein kinase/class 3 adenylate cyclase
MSLSASAPIASTSPTLETYVPLRALGAGPDGTALLARDPSTGALVELRALSRAACSGPQGAALRERLQRVGLLSHPVLRPVLASDLAGASPAVVLAWEGEQALPAGPIPRAEALRLIERIAHALGTAHRVGLVHGALVPSAVIVDANGTPRIELTGLRVQAPEALSALDRACLAPEIEHEPADDRTDVYGLGALLHTLLTGRAPGTNPASLEAPLGPLLLAMLAPDRDVRPSAAEVCMELRRLAHEAPSPRETLVKGVAPVADESSPVGEGSTLGRFRLLRRLGAGGMGEVYQGVDLGSGAVVAVKVLHPKYGQDAQLLRRFRKEARMLAEIRNPYIANLLEVNCDRGLHFLAMEFLAGANVADMLEQRGRLPEREALALVAEVCRALEEPHRRGIIHRDIKPENILYVDANPDPARAPRVKLCDFGIARNVQASEGTRVTREGMIVGTPMFMAPEQCSDGVLGPATDVYALGVTLFLLLTGRAPFVSDDSMQLLLMHVQEPPPALSQLLPEVSAATAALVARALEKDPSRRFTDAGALLDAVEKILRGEPADISVHPPLPVRRAERVMTFAYEWSLAATPAAVWPFVADTDRMNKATGLPAARFELRPAAEGGTEAFGEQHRNGQHLRWREHPFEWIEGRRWSVLRVFERGPMRWYVAEVELQRRPGGGTRLRWTMKTEPRYRLASLLVAIAVRLQLRPALGRWMARLDAAATQPGIEQVRDPFQPPPQLANAAEERVTRVSATLRKAGCDPQCVEHLASFVRYASDQDIARLRPLAFARRHRLDAEAFVSTCLHAAQQGLLVLLWDVICPLCRIPTDLADSLKRLEEHGHCRACAADFALDFAHSIELVFRVAPAVRPSEVRTYCIGGPAFSPHVVAQVRLQPGERFLLPLGLETGSYRVRSPQLPAAVELQVGRGERPRRAEVRLGDDAPTLDLAAGEQQLVLTNTLARELVVRLERRAARQDALTAAHAAALPLFRELFPGEVLAPGQLVSVTNIALLVTTLEDTDALFTHLGDARAFELLLRQFRLLADAVAREGGALLKTVGGGAVAVFERPLAAVRAALAVPEALAAEPKTAGLRLRLAVHQGPALAANVNERLDYFGRTANVAAALPSHGAAGEVLLSRAVAEEPEVATLLHARGLQARVVPLGALEPGLWGIAVAATQGTHAEANAAAE